MIITQRISNITTSIFLASQSFTDSLNSTDERKSFISGTVQVFKQLTGNNQTELIVKPETLMQMQDGLSRVMQSGKEALDSLIVDNHFQEDLFDLQSNTIRASIKMPDKDGLI